MTAGRRRSRPGLTGPFADPVQEMLGWCDEMHAQIVVPAVQVFEFEVLGTRMVYRKCSDHRWSGEQMQAERERITRMTNP